MAIQKFKSELRKAQEALSRAGDNADQFTVNATAREYIAGQLDRVRNHVREMAGIMVEHGCTLDLDAGDDTPTRIPNKKCPHCNKYLPLEGVIA